jgi:hypothetical protein
VSDKVAKECRVAKKYDLQMMCLCASCMMSFGSAFAQALDMTQVSSGGPESQQTVVVYGKRASLVNTCVDSATPNAALRMNLPLPNLSRNNIVSMSERDGLFVRLAAGQMFNR